MVEHDINDSGLCLGDFTFGFVQRHGITLGTSYSLYSNHHGISILDNSGLDIQKIEGDFATPVKDGDTVGCGYDSSKGSIYFILSGHRLERGHSNVRGRIFPVTGVNMDGLFKIRANFGSDPLVPFKWPQVNTPEGSSEIV